MSNNDWGLSEIPTSPPNNGADNGNGTMIEIPATGGDMPFETPPPMSEFEVPDLDGIGYLAQVPASQGSISKDSTPDALLSIPEDDNDFLMQQQEENQEQPQEQYSNPNETNNKGGSKAILAAIGVIGALALGGMGYLAMNLLGGSDQNPPTVEKQVEAASSESESLDSNNEEDAIEPPIVNEEGKLSTQPVQDSDIPPSPTASDIFSMSASDVKNDETQLDVENKQASQSVAAPTPKHLSAAPASDVGVKNDEKIHQAAKENTVDDLLAQNNKTDVKESGKKEEKNIDASQVYKSDQTKAEVVSKDENPPASVQSQDPKDSLIRQLEARVAELEMQKECVAPKHSHKETKKQIKKEKKPVVKKEKSDKKATSKSNSVQKVFPFKVSAISYGQIWIYKNLNQTLPYTVGDTLPNGEKILEVDYNNYTVKTNRGTYKVSLSR